MDNQRILKHIMRTEGWPQFTHHPSDRGGATKGGITQATLSRWRGRRVSAEVLKDLTRSEGRRIYQQMYIEEPAFDRIEDDLLRWQVVDAGVLHGPRRATKWLQRAVGDVEVDGIFGPMTEQAVANCDCHAVALRFAACRIRFLGRLINRNAKARHRGATERDQALFAEGWLNRVTRFLDRESEVRHERP